MDPRTDLLVEVGDFDVAAPEDRALLVLLVHVAFSDGEVQDDEVAFLLQVLPDRDPEELRAWVAAVAQEGPLDYQALAQALPRMEQRWKALRFGARMAWKDGTLHPRERELLTTLAEQLELPQGALQSVLDEMAARVEGGIAPTRLVEVLTSVDWDAVQLASGKLSSQDLIDAAPEGSELVARVGLDQVEVLGLYREGLVGRFLEGTRFLRWEEVVTYTRVPTFGASVQLHTEDGRSWTLVDTRLRGLALLLDRLTNKQRPKRPSSPIKIEQVR